MRKPLDPKAAALLSAIAAASSFDLNTMPIEEARNQVNQGYARMKIPVQPVGSVQNIKINTRDGELPLRIYTPEGTAPFPVIVFFHGGGWVFFDLDAYDPICSHLCKLAGYIMVSVDYRLSPEYRFPAAIDDSLAATRWVSENISGFGGDPGKLFLAGDSAGGNLATVTALRIRDEGGPAITGQVIIYPVTDYCEPEKRSFIEFAEGFGLTRESLKWFWHEYLADIADSKNPLAAPLLAPDVANLPPAIIILAGYDPLYDDGLAYAERLAEAGVKVTLSVYEEMIHGFISYLGILPQAHVAITEITTWLRTLNR